MSKLFLDVLHVRRPRLTYVSPAVCENRVDNSSGFQFPVLLLGELASSAKVQGIFISFEGGANFTLKWGTIPGAICYTVYRLQDVLDPFGAYSVIAECITDDEIIITDQPPGTGNCYIITALLPSGIITQVSDPICIDIPPNEPPKICYPTPQVPCGPPIDWPPTGGGGPSGQCAIIIWQASTPVDAEVGDDVTLGPVILALGAGVTKYEWYKDGVFYLDTTATTKESLQLNDVVEEDSGSYRLRVYPTAAGCAPFYSNPIVLTVETLVCPVLGGSLPTIATFQGITASKDPAISLAIANRDIVTPTDMGFYLLDTNTESILIENTTTTLIGAGCFAIGPSRFCFVDINGSVQMIETDGTPLTPVAPSFPSSSVLQYSEADDLVYFVTFDAGTLEDLVVTFNPNTNTIVAETSLGIGSGVPPNLLFCPTPKRLFVTHVTGAGKIDVYSPPDMTFIGTMDFNTDETLVDSGLGFASSTGKVYVLTAQSVAPFNALMHEVNPTTLTVDYTYDLGVPASFGGFIDYNVLNDRLYLVINGDLLTVDPVTRTVLCVLTPPAPAHALSVDLGSQKVVTMGTPGTTQFFHH